MGSWEFVEAEADSVSVARTEKLEPATALTIAGWYYHTTTQANLYAMIAKKDFSFGGGQESWFIHSINSNSNLGFGLRESEAVYQRPSIGNLVTDRWLFFAATWAAGQGPRLRLWDENGTLVGDATDPDVINSIDYDPAGALVIGNGSRNMHLRAFGVHDAVLSDADLKSWRRNLVPPITLSGIFLPLDSNTAEDTHQGHTINVSGAAYDDTTEPAPVTAGSGEGGSWSFDNVDDYLEAIHSASIASPATEITIWAWWRPSSAFPADSYAGIVHKGKASTNGYVTYSLGVVQGAGRIKGETNVTTSLTNDLDDPNPHPVDQWVFTAFSWRSDTGTRRLRVWNAVGTLITDITDTLGQGGSLNYDTKPLRIGRNEGSSTLGGHIAYVGTHNAIVSDADLDTIRTTGVPPFTPSAFFLPLDSEAVEDTAQNNTFVVSGASFDVNQGPPVELSPRVLRSNTDTPAPSITPSLSLSSTPAVGRGLVAAIAVDKSAGSIEVNTADGWQIVQSYIGPSVSGALAVKSAADGNASDTVVWTLGGTPTEGPSLWIGELSLDNVTVAGSSEGDSANLNTASQSTGATGTVEEGTLAIAMMATDSGWNVDQGRAWSNGYTEKDWVHVQSDTGWPGLSVATKFIDTAGTTETTYSATGGESGSGVDQMYAAVAVLAPSDEFISVRSGGVANVSAQGTGDGARRSTSGGTAAVTATGHGSGLRSVRGGGTAQVTATATGQGSRRATAGGSAGVSATGVGAGARSQRSSGTAQITAAATGSGTRRQRSGGEAQVVAQAVGDGSKTEAGRSGGVSSVQATATGSGFRSVRGGGTAAVAAQGVGSGTHRAVGGGSASVDVHAVGGGTRPQAPRSGGSAVVGAQAQGSGSRRVTGGGVSSAVITATGSGFRRVTIGAVATVTAHALGNGYNPDKALVRYITIYGNLDAREIAGAVRVSIELTGSFGMVAKNQNIDDLFEGETPVILVTVPGDVSTAQEYRLVFDQTLLSGTASYSAQEDETTITFDRLPVEATAGKGGRRVPHQSRMIDAQGNVDFLSEGVAYIRHSQFEEVS